MTLQVLVNDNNSCNVTWSMLTFDPYQKCIYFSTSS